MALLTAEDVLNKAFSKTKYREGFDQDEVDDFLDDIAHTISSLTAERDDLAARLQAALAGQASQPMADPLGGPYGGRPAPASAPPAPATPAGGLLAAATDPNPSPTGMLAMAQKLHDEYVTAAEAEKERIVSAAKAEADRILNAAQTEAQTRMDGLIRERGELERKIDDLRRFERDYRGRLTTYLENLLGDLDHGAGKDRAPGDNRAP
ncbi:MAG: cell division protein DivIVA [Actinobacteria bacterium HGW-Actinobacteria-4]|nr:MAG: cell division protein DivIVA [Actinobacteria bacterium HGW-Actinobacteria-4]